MMLDLYKFEASTASSSHDYEKSQFSPAQTCSASPSLDEGEFINILYGSNPVKVEVNRLENEVKDKDRELGEAQAEIKALRLSERMREKAGEEVCCLGSATNVFCYSCGVEVVWVLLQMCFVIFSNWNV